MKTTKTKKGNIDKANTRLEQYWIEQSWILQTSKY